jgi:TRAP-type uncharacterized transport system fused permease subunit
MIGDWQTILSSCVTASVGVVLFAAGLHGYLIAPASLWQRALLLIGGLCLIKPGLYTDLAGAALASVVIAAQVIERRNAREQLAKQVL